MQYLEGGWAYTGFCCAVHSAGVSLKIHQIVKCQMEGKRRGHSHTLRHVRGHGHLIKRQRKSGSVKEGEPQLVSQREELAAHILVCVCSGVFECVCGQCCRLRLQGGREGGRRERVAVYAVNRASWLAAGCSDRAIPQDGGECEVTGTLRRGMPLDNSLLHTLHACVYV